MGCGMTNVLFIVVDDHRLNPGEMNNLADIKETVDQRKELSRKLHAGWRDAVPPGIIK